jgi:hypothetical protein
LYNDNSGFFSLLAIECPSRSLSGVEREKEKRKVKTSKSKINSEGKVTSSLSLRSLRTTSQDAPNTQRRALVPYKMAERATPSKSATSTNLEDLNLASPRSSPSTPGTPSSEVSTAPPAQRVSFYVSAADDMLEAVFKHEAFLFSPAEQHALRRFQLLECEWKI